MSEHVTAVGAADFDQQVLASPVPVLVDFWATWCGPCRQMAPALEQAAAELSDRARVVKVDIDANPKIAARYGISSVPTLIVFAGGEVVSVVAGAKPRPQIVAQVEAAL